MSKSQRVYPIVTWLLVLILFCCHACVLDAVLIYWEGPHMVTYAVLDGVIFIYMCLGFSLSQAATRGGVQWVLVSWILCTKIIILYWKVFTIKPAPHYDDGFLFIEPESVEGQSQMFDGRSGTRAVALGLSLSPLTYGMLTHRGMKQLYGMGADISVESMLFFDTGFHVMLDLLDLTAAFVNHSRYLGTVPDYQSWIHTMAGIVVVAALFLHSFSFPTSSTSQTPIILSRSRVGDVFITRKHAALVGIFVVDVPLLIVRISAAITSPNHVELELFALKNIICVPVQAYRLTQCQLAQREQSRMEVAQQTEMDMDATKIHQTPPPSPSPPPTEKPEPEKEEETKPTHLHRILQRPPWGSIEFPESPYPQFSDGAVVTQREPRQTSAATRLRSVGTAGTRPADSEGALSPPTSTGRRVTTTFASPRSILGRFTLRSNRRFHRDTSLGSQRAVSFLEPEVTSEPPGDAGSLELNHRGDEGASDAAVSSTVCEEDVEEAKSERGEGTTELQRMINEMRTIKSLPVKGFSFAKILKKTWTCSTFGGRHGLTTILDEKFVLSYWKQLRATFPVLVGLATEISIVAAFLSPNEEVVPMTKWKTVFDIPRDYVYAVFLIICSALLQATLYLCTAPTSDVVFSQLLWALRLFANYFCFTHYRDTHIFAISEEFAIEKIVLLSAAFRPMIAAIAALFPIQSAFLGRTHMYFALGSSLRQGEREMDSYGWVSTSSVLVFMNVRRQYAPFSFNELLVGPNIVKSVRLCDCLTERHWADLLLTFVLYATSLFLFFDWASFALLTANFLCAVLNIICCQAIRLLALRRYEVKRLFEDILHKSALSNDPTGLLAATEALRGKPLEERDDKQLERTLAQSHEGSSDPVVRRFKTEGFFTAPGNIVRAFW